MMHDEGMFWVFCVLVTISYTFYKTKKKKKTPWHIPCLNFRLQYAMIIIKASSHLILGCPKLYFSLYFQFFFYYTGCSNSHTPLTHSCTLSAELYLGDNLRFVLLQQIFFYYNKFVLLHQISFPYQLSYA